MVKVIQPYAKMMDVDGSADGIRLLRKIEWCARISHRSEDAQTPTSWERFLRAVVISHGDWSVVEHASVTVDAVVDRGISHEWVRHRIGAYTQESTRFINYAKKNTTTQELINPAVFICPPSIAALQDTVQDSVYHAWLGGRMTDEEEYQLYIANGIKAQEARTCFPNALATRLVSTYNLRNWRHFFLMRTTREAHPQMREVTIPLLNEFKAKIPMLFDDIEPNAMQADNLSLPR